MPRFFSSDIGHMVSKARTVVMETLKATQVKHQRTIEQF